MVWERVVWERSEMKEKGEGDGENRERKEIKEGARRKNSERKRHGEGEEWERKI